MAALNTINQDASLAITSAKILVAVDTSPPLSSSSPARICCLTFSSWSVVILSSRRFCMAASPCLKAFLVARWAGSTSYACHQAYDSERHPAFPFK